MEGVSCGLKKGAWTAEEDSLLRKCIEMHGEGRWHQVPLRAGLNRCRKSCRLRWLNYLKPSINREAFSADEVDLIIRLHKLLGNRWSLIAGRLPGRTANDVKNYWTTHLSKKQEIFKVKTVKRKVNFPPTPTKKVDIIKPQPRSFSGNGYLAIKGHLESKFPSNIIINENNINNNDDDYDNVFDSNTNITSNIVDNCIFMKDDMIHSFDPPVDRSGEKAWWESLFDDSEESGEKNSTTAAAAEAAAVVAATVSTAAAKEAQSSWMGSGLSTFNEDLWNLLDTENWSPIN